MRVAIVDADLISRYNHRFPNLACEKISAFHKEAGHDVHLETDYGKLDSYDEVFVSKVFTDTPVPDWLKPTDRIHLGGTGFYFDKAPKLPDEIEHHMPDYHLYDDWIHEEMRKAESLALIRGGGRRASTVRNSCQNSKSIQIIALVSQQGDVLGNVHSV